MKIKKRIIILITALNMFSFNIYAEKLVMGIYEELPPYSYKENNQWIGIDIEIGNEIFRRIGIDAGYESYPPVRLIKTAKDGQIAGILATFCFGKEKSDLRDFLEYANVSAYTSKVSVFALKERQIRISGLADLKNRSVGVIRGYFYSSEFDRDKDMKKAEYDNDEQIVKILAKGRIDAGVAESAPFLYFSAKSGLQDKFEEVYVLTENPVCMAFSKQYPGSESKIMADKVSRVIQQLKDEGFIEKILNKYK